MNWFTFIVLSGGIVLLGLAIVFLLFAEIVGKSQDTGWKARRIAASSSKPAPNSNASDSESRDAEVSSQEKIALQTSEKEKRPETRPAVENPSKPEKSDPAPH